jgi:magnesium chelatase family protein
MDLTVSVMPLSGSDWCRPGDGEPSEAVRRRVMQCREIQERRYCGRECRTNGVVRAPFSEIAAHLSPEARSFLTRAADRLSLSGRALCKIVRVARTIADLSGDKKAALPHVAEAAQYRLPDFTRLAGSSGVDSKGGA